ncbi:hypothetical protein FJY84_00135 [Candidatus Bathyarchaeota archaeon]|nr:hypothetical protein [Candidatus Bathyarchaeota archaeon]
MIILFYFQWKGTREERQAYEKEAKERWDKVKGVKLMGFYSLSIGWDRAAFFETDSFDLWLKNTAKKPDLMGSNEIVLFV